eukprot:g6813.t1
MRHLACTDFVLPLKEEGICLKAVVMQIFKFYNPRRLIIVSRPDVLDRISKLIQYWDLSNSDCWKLIFVNEVTLLDAVLGKKSIDTLKSIYEEAYSNSFPDANGIKRREFGWWYQQIIKLAIAEAIVDVSKVYVVWDSDLIALKRWPLFMSAVQMESDVSNPIPTVAILQEHGKKGAFELYCETLKRTIDVEPAVPEGGGTFVTHHMVFDCKTVHKFLQRISNNCNDLPWPIAIVKVSTSALRWSEYLCYASFASNEKKLNFHPYDKFGKDGIRIRDGKFGEILLNMFENVIPNGGFSMQQIKKALDSLCGAAISDQSYLQIDHVYGKVPGSDGSRHLPLLYPKSTWQNPMYSKLNTWSYELFYPKQLKGDGVGDPSMQNKVINRIKFWWQIFLRRKCIFVHVPKNAGTFVESLMEPSLTQPKSLHVTAVELQEMWPSMFDKLYKFAIYRDPILRFISAYGYLYEGGNQKGADLFWSKELKKYDSLENFVVQVFCGGSSEDKMGHSAFEWNINTRLPIHFFPQHVFICSAEGAVLVDALLHIDDLRQNSAFVFFNQHIQGNEISFSRNGGKPSMRTSSSVLKEELLSSLKEETINILKRVYSKDYELENNVMRFST